VLEWLSQIDWPSLDLKKLAEYNLVNTALVGLLAGWAGSVFTGWRQKKEKIRDDRRAVFTTLCSTRGQTLHQRHVEAFNVVPIVFFDAPKVIACYRACLDNFNLKTDIQGKVWAQECHKLLANLLVEMANSLGYRAAREDIETARNPQIYLDIENAQLEVLFRQRSTFERLEKALESGVLDVRLIGEVVTNEPPKPIAVVTPGETQQTSD
jgi:hypothetical protein